MLTEEVYTTYRDILDGVYIVKISVYGLWAPIGALGICIVVLSGACVSFFTGIKANYVWGDLGKKIVNYVVGAFAFLGVITAIFTYQWMTGRLEEQGYLYCKPLSRTSAMSRHEVYVASPELCVKPGKTP
ncbi:MAG: hypothetical protein ACRDA8_11625 [Shewanella sp.]